MESNRTEVGRAEGAVLDVETSTRRQAAGDLLAPTTSMSAVTLHVGDLEGMITFYREALALDVLSEHGTGAALGRGATPLVLLSHTPGLPTPPRNQAGLFHTAILLPNDAALASAVLRATRHPRAEYVGCADHGVSKAFYFTDPEGNGIELYVDRDGDTWVYRDGRVQMRYLPLDAHDYLTEHLGSDADARAGGHSASVGHVHLQVGDLTSAKAFYVDALGFEVTFEFPGALFVAAGGYHHHMAMNTFNSAGAGLRGETLGLGQVTIAVPGRSDLDAVVERLVHRKLQVRDEGDAVSVQDPWNTTVTLMIDDAKAD